MNIFNAWLILLFITLLTRLVPLLAGKWLQKQSWIDSLSSQLPCIILILLLLHEMEPKVLPLGSPSIAPIVALAITLFLQHIKKQIILSVSIGVATYILLGLYL